MWEKGIELCKELASQYELDTFDYEQLSVMLVSLETYSLYAVLYMLYRIYAVLYLVK